MKRRIAACDGLALRDRQAQEIHRLLAAGEAQSRPNWVAQATARKGAALALAADEPGPGALCLGNLAWMAVERQETEAAQHRLDAAMALAVQAREQRRTPGEGLYEVQLLLVQAEVYKICNNLTARNPTVVRALALSSRLNEPRLHCSCHEYAAMDANMRADETDAALHLDAEEPLATEFGLPLAMANAQLERARLHLQCGRWEDAARESTAAEQRHLAMSNAANALKIRAVAAEALWRWPR